MWRKMFSADVHELVQEVLIHICGDSCFKYSGKNVERICRHGFYYIIVLVADDTKNVNKDTVVGRGASLCVTFFS